MRILAIDPEVHEPAYAIIERGAVLAYGKFTRIINAGTKYERFNLKYRSTFSRLWKKWACEDVCIEGQYLHPKAGRGNVQSFASLTKVAGEFELFARERGVNPTTIQPSEWQSAILRCKPTTKREQRKQMSIIVAKALVGKQTRLDHNVADAINIGMYYDNRINGIMAQLAQPMYTSPTVTRSRKRGGSSH